MSRYLFACGCILFGIFQLAHSSVEGNQAPLAPQAGLQKITILAGRWKADGKVFDTEFSKAGVDTSTLFNDCWMSGEFYACDQILDGVSRALIVFTFNASDGTYNTYPITADGGSPGGGLLKIDGNTWTYGRKGDPNNSGPQFRTTNVFEGTAIHYRVEYSRDNEHWTVMREGINRKQN